MTRVTPRVLPPTHPSGDVSRVDEVESLLRADLAGADQDVGLRVAHAAELVILVEGGHVPGDVPVDSRDVSGRCTKLGWIIGKAGYHQREYLQPDPALVHQRDCVQDMREHPAELAVVAVVHGLEVDLVAVS